MRCAAARAALLVVAVVACGGETGPGPFLGTVERTAIEISAPVSEVLVECPVRLGEPVRAGAVLARLDDEVARAQQDAALARLQGARALEGATGPEFARVRGLYRKGVTSSHELDRARSAHEQAVAQVREAEARLAEARKRLSDLVLVAPVDGVVDQLPFDPGERVPPGGVVAVFLPDEPPWVRVWLPASVAAKLRIGSPVEVRVHGIEAPLRGRVIEIARESEFTPHFALTEREREHLVYEARVQILEPPEGLRPGLPAEVRLSEEPDGDPQ